MLSNTCHMLSGNFHMLSKECNNIICCVRNLICCAKLDNSCVICLLITESPKTPSLSRAKIFPAQKCRTIKKLFARDCIAERDSARLPYFTLPGEQQVCITRKGNPEWRLLTKRGRENLFFAPLHSHEPYSSGQKR